MTNGFKGVRALRHPHLRRQFYIRGKCNWDMPVSDTAGLFWNNTYQEQVLSPVKEASATPLGSLLSRDAFEPCKISMAIFACWPGEKGVGSWGSNFKIWESPLLLRADRPWKVCSSMWSSERKANLEVRWFNPCPTQQDILARLLNVMARHCWKALASRTNFWSSHTTVW